MSSFDLTTRREDTKIYQYGAIHCQFDWRNEVISPLITGG